MPEAIDLAREKQSLPTQDNPVKVTCSFEYISKNVQLHI